MAEVFKYNDKISIIVPIYNTPDDLLRKCVISILHQTYKNIEVLLIDDGSKDDVAKNCDYIAQSDKRIRVYHQENKGVSAARNTGIESSTGGYIMFVDADDTIEKNMCSEMLGFLNKESAEVVISGYFRDYMNGKSEKVVWNNETIVFKQKSEKKSLISNMLQPEKGLAFCCCKCYRKDFLDTHALRLDPRLSMGEDVEFSYRVLKCADCIGYMPQPFYHYYFNEKSAVRAFKESTVDDYIKSVQILGEDLLESYKYDKEVCQSYYSLVLYHLLLTMINYSFHPQNLDKRREKIKKFRELCCHPIYKRALCHVNYRCFSITRAIPLFFIVHKLYVLDYCVAMFRHWQFKRRSSL